MSDLRRLPADELRRILALGAFAARAKLTAAQADRAPLEFASPEHERFYRVRHPRSSPRAGWAPASPESCARRRGILPCSTRVPSSGSFASSASLAATTERTFWQDVVDQRLVRNRNRGEHWVDVGPAGAPPSRIWLLGLDADPLTGVPSKVGSLNLDWAGVDEAVELTEADWILLGTAPAHDDAVPPARRGDEPAGPSHWLKRRFTPPTEQRGRTGVEPVAVHCAFAKNFPTLEVENFKTKSKRRKPNIRTN